MEASGVSGLEVTVMAMDLVVTDTVVMVLDLEAIGMVGLEVMGTEVMLILFILKAMLNSHPIKLRRKLMPNLNRPIVNLRRMHSHHRRMHNRNNLMPHRNKHMSRLNKRMCNLNKRMYNLNKPMYNLKHIARLKRMHLNKRMYNPNKHMLNQQLHTQRLPSLHIKIKRTASSLK